jgi:preprotein translocase subunit SecG
MSFIVGILTFALVINCLLLILLVLIQLPKKDAGAGMAFGAGAADALFGAGSGNVLTKVTKYATIIFVGVALLTGWLQQKNFAQSRGAAEQDAFIKSVAQKQQSLSAKPAATPPTPAKPATTLLSTEVTTNSPAK